MGYMTEERRLIQETARAFAMKEVLPLANKLDPEKGDMPPELICRSWPTWAISASSSPSSMAAWASASSSTA